MVARFFLTDTLLFVNNILTKSNKSVQQPSSFFGNELDKNDRKKTLSHFSNNFVQSLNVSKTLEQAQSSLAA